MFYNKIFFTFTIILFISQLDFTYSFEFKSPYNYTDIACANNRIGVKINENIQFSSSNSFPFNDTRNFIWSFYNLLGKDSEIKDSYYRESMINLSENEKNCEGNTMDLENYVYFNLLPDVTSLEDFFDFENKERIEEIYFD